ncbi:amino acid ABC transporter permease [Labrys okinawensis]|uniref:amino acid ABC transporter permease n=1 Tax=Labrys okinawensis TaxID=346911 RepID=UPI0039BC44AB
MNWLIGFYNYRVVAESLPQLAAGLAVTIEVSGAAFVLALVLGIALASARTFGGILVKRAVVAYVEAVRSTPLLIQLYVLYFALGPLPLIGRLTAFEAGVIALGFNGAAYFGEILRAGLESVSRQQSEAARALGMSAWQTFRLVILPQAIRHVVPPLIGQTAMLIKDSSIVSFVGIVDLTGAGTATMNDRLLPNEGFLTIAACYLVIYLMSLGLVAIVTKRKSQKRAEPRKW